MKRTYTKPVVKFIDYEYEEQVIAASSKFDGLGDGHNIDYCTYESGLFAAPCSDIVLSQFGPEKCHFMPRFIIGE